MPDRAVVDDGETIWNVRVAAWADTEDEARALVYHTVKHPLANQDGVALMGIAPESSHPRAVVGTRSVCRECGRTYLTDKVRTYFVVRDGGDEYSEVELCPACVDVYENDDDVESIEEEIPQPRHLVALSDDRQWLVVLEPTDEPDVEVFAIYRYDRTHSSSWRFADSYDDTGQDAHEVLARWLEGGTRSAGSPSGSPDPEYDTPESVERKLQGVGALVRAFRAAAQQEG